MELSITKDEKGYLQVDVPSPEQLLQLMQESRHKLLSRSIVEKKCSDGGAIVSVTGTQDFDRYDNDVVVALYVASHKSMRQIARELNLDVSNRIPTRQEMGGKEC